MTQWNLFLGCREGSTYENPSKRHTTLAKQRTKIMYVYLFRSRRSI
jgi:hypothetical protein